MSDGKFSRLYDHEKQLAAMRDAAPAMFEALVEAREWLSGWASAEPYIGTIDAVLNKARGL